MSRFHRSRSMPHRHRLHRMWQGRRRVNDCHCRSPVRHILCRLGCQSSRPGTAVRRYTVVVGFHSVRRTQTGAYGIPSAERYGAIIPESTRSGIKPARPSPVTVVIHTTAARPAVPSVNSRPSLVFCCSLHFLEHSTQRHSICTISFFLSPAAKDIPVSSILPWHYPLIFCTAHSWTSQQFRLFF